MRMSARTADYKIAEVLGVSQGLLKASGQGHGENARRSQEWRESEWDPGFDEPFIEYTPVTHAHRHPGDEMTEATVW
jgi:hypothetical protein